MKSIVNSTALWKELKKMGAVVSKNTVLPILSCVKLDFGKEVLTLIASDLETTAVHHLGCESKSPFSVVIDFASLVEILSLIPDQPLSIEKLKNGISLIYNNAKSILPNGGDIVTFPNIPEDSFAFSVDVEEDFFSALYLANSCRGKDNSVTTLNTPCLDFKKTGLTIVGTDAMILYKKDFDIKAKTLSKARVGDKFVSLVKEFQNGKLFIGEKFVKLEQNGTSVITRLIDDKYCGYELVIPNDIKFNLKINRTDLMLATRRASVTASSTTKICLLKFVDWGIKITSEDTDFEKSGEMDVKSAHDVEIDAIGIYATQLLQTLNMLTSDEIEMAFSDPRKSIYIRPTDDETTLCLLQPVSILS